MSYRTQFDKVADQFRAETIDKVSELILRAPEDIEQQIATLAAEEVCYFSREGAKLILERAIAGDQLAILAVVFGNAAMAMDDVQQLYRSRFNAIYEAFNEVEGFDELAANILHEQSVNDTEMKQLHEALRQSLDATMESENAVGELAEAFVNASNPKE